MNEDDQRKLVSRINKTTSTIATSMKSVTSDYMITSSKMSKHIKEVMDEFNRRVLFQKRRETIESIIDEEE